MKLNNKLLKKNLRKNKLERKSFFEQGFTFIEFIIVVSLLGLAARLIVPPLKTSINKSRQKEASLIVSSMLKSSQSYYGIYGFLPKDIGQLSKFANFQKCIANQAGEKGNIVCRNSLPTKVEKQDDIFFSPSGNYKLELRIGERENEGSMFLVKANPNGGLYAEEGSAVIGCYSPISGITLLKEYSSKKFDRGSKNFITCGVETKIASASCELYPNDPKCKIEDPKFCELYPNDPKCKIEDPMFCELYPNDPKCKIEDPLRLPPTPPNPPGPFTPATPTTPSDPTPASSNLDLTITNSKVRNIIETSEETNNDNSFNQINVTKRIERITSTNQKQKFQNDAISKSELDDEGVYLGPIPPWIR